MALHMDPQTPVEKFVGGITYLLRVLTQREMARFATHSAAVSARLKSFPEDAPATLDEDDIRRLERCLCLGVAGWNAEGRPEWKSDHEGPRHMDAALLDSIPFGDWMDLYLAIVSANQLTEADAKNSPSPPQ